MTHKKVKIIKCIKDLFFEKFKIDLYNKHIILISTKGDVIWFKINREPTVYQLNLRNPKDIQLTKFEEATHMRLSGSLIDYFKSK